MVFALLNKMPSSLKKLGLFSFTVKEGLYDINAVGSIDVTDEGITIEVKESQFAKAKLSIFVTSGGIVMAGNLLQLEKAPLLIDVSDAGRLTDVKFEH